MSDDGAPELLDEAAFLAAWREAGLADASPATAAYEGGRLADRPAWVFVAGYQAAIRARFPEIECAGWLAFAVSEDRNVPEDAVVATADDAEWSLSGCKTWVAQVDHVQELIVSARNHARTELFRVPVDFKGVQLERRADPKFLAALSQGQARFDEAPAARLDDPQRRRSFMAAEALAMMLAATGYAHRHSPDDADSALRSLAAVVPRLEDALADLDALRATDLLALDEQWQAPFEHWCAAANAATLPEFEADGRLFQLYRAGIAQQAEREQTKMTGGGR
ncbi:MAG: hypothetical protein AAGI15_15585 [Pseudomonadota bacterium]